VLEGRDRLLRLGLGLAAGDVVVPGHRVHQRLDEERLHVDVVGEAPGDVVHGVGVGAVEGGAVLRRLRRVARDERAGERLLSTGVADAAKRCASRATSKARGASATSIGLLMLGPSA
jgi:hypothetical protein